MLQNDFIKHTHMVIYDVHLFLRLLILSPLSNIYFSISHVQFDDAQDAQNLS